MKYYYNYPEVIANGRTTLRTLKLQPKNKIESKPILKNELPFY